MQTDQTPLSMLTPEAYMATYRAWQQHPFTVLLLNSLKKQRDESITLLMDGEDRVLGVARGFSMAYAYAESDIWLVQPGSTEPELTSGE